jgi:4-hydroxy-tetrahydrodipicolinate reductase
MTKVIVAGAAGRMGCRLIALANASKELQLVGALEAKGHPALGQDAGALAGCGTLGIPLTEDLSSLIGQGDVVIEFSNPSATLEHLACIAQARKAMVIGTTGFSQEELSHLNSLTTTIPCVFAPNMSVGVNVLLKALADMAKIFGDDYDIEVVESHHHLKKDAPSGTALKIAEVLADSLHRDLGTVGVYGRQGLVGERTKTEIGIHAVRAGDIVGDHTVFFGGIGERIEVTHRAHSRDTFASGALRAARWVVTQQPGLYDMQDVLGLK